VTIPYNKLVHGKSGLQGLLQLAKLSMHRLCLVAVGTVQAFAVVEIWNSNLVQVTLQQNHLGSEGDVDDSKWRVVVVFHCQFLGGMTASSMVVSGMQAEPKLLCIDGRSVDDIALPCKNSVDAKSYTFAGSRIVGIEFSTSTGIGVPLMVCGETVDSLLVSVAVIMPGEGGVSTVKGTTFLATASVQAMEGSSFQVMPYGLGIENSMTGAALEANPVVPLLALALGLSNCHNIILQCFHWKFVKDKCPELIGLPSWHGITSGGDASVFSRMCPALQVAFFGVSHTGVRPVLIHFCDSINSKIGGAEVTLEHGGMTDGDPDKDSDKEPDGISDGGGSRLFVGLHSTSTDMRCRHTSTDMRCRPAIMSMQSIWTGVLATPCGRIRLDW